MNEASAQLIDKLATKLGTTAEHLWGVLLRQAPIDAILDFIWCVGLIIACFYVGALVRRKTTVPAKTEGDKYPRAEWEQEFAFFAWLGTGILLLVTFIVIACSMYEITTVLVNPEYWALEQILRARK